MEAVLGQMDEGSMGGGLEKLGGERHASERTHKRVLAR